MRVSEAALALITRFDPAGVIEYLVIRNTNGQAYSLIGGHRKVSESFHECCRREVIEELQPSANARVEVAPFPWVSLRFNDHSGANGEETDYHWQVFPVRVDDQSLQRMPPTCAWVSADQIRAGRTRDGKLIADQARRVLKAVEDADFDLFVSYGQSDNKDGSVTALIESIQKAHERFVPTKPLKIFFDLWGIRNSDEWDRRIHRGLIESKAMLAVLSPSYFNSEWCRREYDTFVEQQRRKVYPGEPIHAIYIIAHPDFELTGDNPKRNWFEDIKRRQFLDAKNWWPDGPRALESDIVAGRLNELRQSIWDRISDIRFIQRSPTNLTAFNINFVGREHELAELWNKLRLDHAVAISAIQGVGGLGKTALARAYAHSRRREYLGGQFEIAMEKISTPDGLRLEIVQLANLYLAVAIPDELTNTNLGKAFARARSAFERLGQGKILLILDNVAYDGVLSQRADCLPSSEYVHVLATTRLDPERWGIDSLRLEALNTADALDLFLKYRPFEIPDDEHRWHRVRLGQERIPETDIDDEWKAAVAIVNRLGGHALAVEVVAVYLGAHRSIRLKDYLNGLVDKGLSLKLGQAGDDPHVRARLSAAIQTDIGQLLEPTFVRLETDNPLAMQALEWAALMPPDQVPWSWLRGLLELNTPGVFDHDADEPDPWTDGVVSQLLGWRLLTCDSGGPTARMHRIVQSVIENRPSLQRDKSSEGASSDEPESGIAGRFSSLDRLLSFLVDRSEFVLEHWGKPGINWELSPLLDAAWKMLEKVGVRAGPLVDRLITPLRLDGRLLPAIKIQQAISKLEIARLADSPGNADYARDLSVSYNKLGDLFRALGNGVQAREF